ncbi:MAG TPA: hypothetical protein VFU54_09975 [Actinomycetota bacterium]|nr:hypothetical protein [Actinomycetota bacterium]
MSDDSGIDLDRIEALAAAAGLPIEEYLQAAVVAHTRRRNKRQASESSLYSRIRYAGGLRRLVDKLYPRVLADPSLTRYFKHLDDHHLKGLRWHMLTLLAVVTGGPSKYQGRDLHEAHAELQITGEASTGWPGICSERFRSSRSRRKTSRPSSPRCRHGGRRS